MSNKKISISLIISAIFYILVVASLSNMAWIAYSSSMLYSKTAKNLASKSNMEESLETQKKKLFELFSLGTYKGYSNHVNEMKSLMKKKQKYKRDSMIATQAFFFVLGIYIIMFYCFFNKDEKRQYFIYSLLLITLVSLITGLFTPIIMIEIHKDVPIIDQVVFQFQSKGIITTILKLFTIDDITTKVLGVLLFLFSVITPLIKIITIGVICFNKTYLKTEVIDFFKYIGKWSFVDVLVVAQLLVYFAVDADKFTEARLQNGLYFFSGYLFLSIFALHLSTHNVSKVQEES